MKVWAGANPVCSKVKDDWGTVSIPLVPAFSILLFGDWDATCRTTGSKSSAHCCLWHSGLWRRDALPAFFRAAKRRENNAALASFVSSKGKKKQK